VNDNYPNRNCLQALSRARGIANDSAASLTSKYRLQGINTGDVLDWSDACMFLALIGPSGSGKTTTALTIATDLAPDGRITLIDTERGSASKYADLLRFDIGSVRAPPTPGRPVRGR